MKSLSQHINEAFENVNEALTASKKLIDKYQDLVSVDNDGDRQTVVDAIYDSLLEHKKLSEKIIEKLDSPKGTLLVKAVMGKGKYVRQVALLFTVDNGKNRGVDTVSVKRQNFLIEGVEAEVTFDSLKAMKPMSTSTGHSTSLHDELEKSANSVLFELS